MSDFLTDLHNHGKTVVTDPIAYIIDLTERAKDGDENALKSYIELVRITKVADAAAKDIKHLAIDEAEKHPEKTFEAFGATVQKKNDAGRWKFDHIASWNTFKNKLKEVEELAKQAHKMKTELADAATGEIIEAAEYTEGKSNIAITIQ